MDSLTQLLKQNLPQEPPQIAALKTYVRDTYNEVVQVQVGRDGYIMKVSSGTLANRLQMDSHNIATVCELDKPLRIHISHE